jgi:uncharacterized DUF497 family protein
VDITFDPTKNERNIRERGLSFERVSDLDFRTATYAIDTRHDYGETRIVAVGYLDGREHVLCFTEAETGIRVISFRKANAGEVRRYEKIKAAHGSGGRGS